MLAVAAAFFIHYYGFGFVYVKLILFVLVCIFSEKTNTSKTLTIFWGIGSVIVIKGSNVIDYFLQSGQVTLDLYWPVIKSVIIDWFLLIWVIQLYSATIWSLLPLLSTDET
jgi:hypothetical protein